MSPRDLIERARAVGVSLWRDGNMVRWRAPGPLPEDLRQELVAHKADLLEVLGTVLEGAQVRTCLTCQHSRRTAHPHLLDCAAGIMPSAAAGFWPGTPRVCSTWRPPAIVHPQTCATHRGEACDCTGEPSP